MKSEQTSHSRTAHPRIAGSAWLLSAVLAVVVPTAGWAQTYTRTEVTTYHDNTSLWVMGQVKKVTNADTGVVLSQTEYDTATALPVTFYGPGTGAVQGKVQQTITYDEVSRETEDIRVENPDDPEIYVMVTRIKTITFSSSENGVQRTFKLSW